jgi:hypothetical protein
MFRLISESVVSAVKVVWCRRDRGGKQATKVRRMERMKKLKATQERPSPYWKPQVKL